MAVYSPEKISIIETKSGGFSIKVTLSESGLQKTLHSIYDPEAEASRLVSSFEFSGKGLLIVLGLGLGYHVGELTKRYPETEIIVVEAAPEIHKLAQEYGPKLDDRVEIITGLPAVEVIRRITKRQIEKGFVPISIFSLSSAISAFPDYYRPILTSLKNTTSVRLWEKLRYPKFREESLKVLLIDSDYFLLREIEKALRSLGHKVVKIPVFSKAGSKEGYINDNEGLISRFIEVILNFKPDFLLTINHLGFDEEGILTALFQSIEMPVASWYVDNPNFIVKAFDKNVSSYVSLFLWDGSYISDMKTIGFESVRYLPLGTDEKVFKVIKDQRKKLNKYICDVGFVGNSMIKSVNEWMCKLSKDIHLLIDRLAERIVSSNNPVISLSRMLHDDERKIVDGLNEKKKMDFEAAVLWKATLLYRLSCIKMLEGFDVRIHGDNGWRELLKNGFKLYPPLNYYKELPFFYNACKINFNATHFQMSKAVNQRVFDVPACGAFLLTDYQESLNELFKVGKEIVTYRDRDEIQEIVKYYLQNPEQRKAVAMKGRERVLKEHTYKHRLRELINYMKRRYK
jgi:spore maturation protein CgeB